MLRPVARQVVNIAQRRGVHHGVHTRSSAVGLAAAGSPEPNNAGHKIPRVGLLNDSTVDVDRLLASYPSFQLNIDEANAGGNAQSHSKSLHRSLGPQPGDEAILTLSGGVDSSVAAYLALQKGGLVPSKTIFMRNWNSLEEQQGFEPGAGGSQGCQWMRDWDIVQRMARWLGVEAELVDLSAEYWNNVFSPSLDEWGAGLTPNPDVMCNTEIKFGALLDRLDAQGDGADDAGQNVFGRRQKRRWLVTGHYAGIQYYAKACNGNIDALQSSVVHGRLHRAADKSKDQSYFLSAVGALQLGRTHFPLANSYKSEVRQLARSLDMPTAHSEESMGLCFVGERHKRKPLSSNAHPAPSFAKTQALVQLRGRTAQHNGFADFLGEYIDARPGPIVTADGAQLGMHNGLHTLTIGQGARIGGIKNKHFVAAKDAASNTVLVVPGSAHPWLRCHMLRIDDFSFISKEDSEDAISPPDDHDRTNQWPLHAQIRHRSDAVRCRAERMPSSTNQASASRAIRVIFKDPVLSVAEGQVCAIYLGSQCLGSGVISSVETGAPKHRAWVPIVDVSH